MSIITLISDWNKSDYYIGIVKGIIQSKCDKSKIIDITHNIEHFNYPQAGFIAKATTKHFPKDTVHIIAVNSEATKDHKHIIIKHNQQYFILANNGIAGFMFKDTPDLIIEMETIEVQTSFPEATIFANIAAFISCGGDIKELGEETKHIYRQVHNIAAVDKNSISGTIIFNDSYGNAISNITKQEFITYGKERNYEILLSNNNRKITKLSKNYNDVIKGEKLALFNSINLLEIAINDGSAENLFSLYKGVSIRIKFFD